MDTKSRERFEEILRKEAAALTPGEIDILRARVSYLSSADRERYADVLPSAKAPVEKKAGK